MILANRTDRLDRRRVVRGLHLDGNAGRGGHYRRARRGLAGAYLLGRLNDAKVDATKIRAREVSAACEIYMLDNGQWPNQLTDLLQMNPNTGKGPYLKNQEYVIAPLTGQPFQYDPSGQHGLASGNTAVVPDVYVMDPKTGRPIGNFK